MVPQVETLTSALGQKLWFSQMKRSETEVILPEFSPRQGEIAKFRTISLSLSFSSVFFHQPKKESEFWWLHVYRFNQGSFLCRVSNFSERRDEEIYHVSDHIFMEYKSSMICWCHFFFINRISIWLKRIYNEIKKLSRRTRNMLDNNNHTNKEIKNVIGNAGERIVSVCKRNVSTDSNRSRIMRDE